MINVVLAACLEICAAFDADYVGYAPREDACVCYDHVEKFHVWRHEDREVLWSDSDGRFTQ